MIRRAISALTLLSAACVATGQQAATYDYFSANRQMVRNGVQAILMCNGLFTSNRSLQEVFRYELAYMQGDRLGGAVGTVDGGTAPDVPTFPFEDSTHRAQPLAKGRPGHGIGNGCPERVSGFAHAGKGEGGEKKASPVHGKRKCLE